MLTRRLLKSTIERGKHATASGGRFAFSSVARADGKGPTKGEEKDRKKKDLTIVDGEGVDRRVRTFFASGNSGKPLQKRERAVKPKKGNENSSRKLLEKRTKATRSKKRHRFSMFRGKDKQGKDRKKKGSQLSAWGGKKLEVSKDKAKGIIPFPLSGATGGEPENVQCELGSP